MEIIYTPSQVFQFESEIKNFETLYNRLFPDPNEREDFSHIKNRLCTKKFSDDSKTFLILEDFSGLLCEYYLSCRSIFITYIAIDEKSRGKGLAKKIINKGVLIDLFKIIKKNTGNKPQAVFFESNNPCKTKYDSFDPYTRLNIFRKMGARYINIPYIQPSLGENKSRVDNLLLFVFPIKNQKTQNFIKSNIIISFLFSFYKEFGVINPNSDPDFINMINSIDSKYTYLYEVPLFKKLF